MLLAGVLRRAREALLAGRGSEASSLLKATREYVLVQQDEADARDAVDGQIRTWDTAQPARAGELTEAMTLHALHGFWSRLSPAEQAERCAPDGTMGFRAWAEAVEAARKGGGDGDVRSGPRKPGPPRSISKNPVCGDQTDGLGERRYHSKVTTVVDEPHLA